jgi:hypothetical protein
MESPHILLPGQKLLNKSPELAAGETMESLKDFLGTDYNLWTVLGEICKEMELLGVTYDGFIDDGRYVMKLRQDYLDDEKQAAYVKELLAKVFRDLSRLKVEAVNSNKKVSLVVDLDSES